MRRLALLALLASGGPAAAQIPLYAQRLPEGTVYLRLANALPGPVQVQAGFAGRVSLGADGADRISPYFVDREGAQAIPLQVTVGGQESVLRVEPASGSFVTVLLQPSAAGVRAVPVLDHPEYNQLRARLTFYNATPDCAAGSLGQAGGGAVFTAVPPGGVQARSVNPVDAALVAGCARGEAPPLALGRLEEGSLTSVWLMQPAGQLLAFTAHDTIAPPRG